ncbi:hypothetical protein N7467_012066 [Penicillium canescens]|nr:hypothetical protein N7467_012066 [Penicillium canescens]
MNIQTRKNLAGLRLVNKTFCHSASIRLFRHIIALAGSLCHTTHLPSVGKLVGISSSQYAQYTLSACCLHACVNFPISKLSISAVRH